MECANQIVYRIQQGDSLYQIGQRFGIPVQEIIAMNGHIDPQNLQIGDVLRICAPEQAVPGVSPCTNELALRQEMENLWEEQQYWMDQLVYVADDPAASDRIQNELLLTNQTMMALFSECFGRDAAVSLENLLRMHLTIGVAYILASQRGDKESVDELSRRWRENANQIAIRSANLNPFFDPKMLHQMWNDHIQEAEKEIADRINQSQ